jgi:hypothetical protein
MAAGHFVSISIATVFAISGAAHGQVFAAAGFNDRTGINGDGVTNNLPYNINNAVLFHQGLPESGWSGFWFTQGTPTVVSSGQSEGDGAAFFQNGSDAQRGFSSPTSAFQRISIALKLQGTPSGGNGFDERIFGIGGVGPWWRLAPDGRFLVLDGNGGGGSFNFIDTGFFCTPGFYQSIQVDINTVAQTWQFFVNGVMFNAPHPLGFYNSPTTLDQIQFINDVPSPNGIFLDAVIVGVPGPSSLALICTPVFAAVFRNNRRIRSCYAV